MENAGLGGLRFGIVLAVRETEDDKMTIKVINTKPLDYWSLTPRTTWTSTRHMLKVDPKIIHPSVVEKLKKAFVGYPKKTDRRLLYT